jgi:hypothetical protein
MLLFDLGGAVGRLIEQAADLGLCFAGAGL